MKLELEFENEMNEVEAPQKTEKKTSMKYRRQNNLPLTL